MEERIRPEMLAGLMEQATRDVFEKMLGLPLVASGFRVDNEPSTANTGLISMVGFVGDWIGMGSFYCSPAMGCRIADALFLTTHLAVEEEVMDAAAEMANMVIGNVKTELEKDFGTLMLSIPTVIYGRNFVKRSRTRREWVITTFASDGEILEVQVSMYPNPQPTPGPFPHGQQMFSVHI